MTLKVIDSDSPYIFWLFDWGYKTIARRLQITPRYVRCDISSKGVHIHDMQRPLFIPLENIIECERFRLRGTGDASGTNLRIKFVLSKSSPTQNEEAAEIFLLPANVMKHYEDSDDLRTMLTLIQALRNGQNVSIEKNPYHRRLIRQGRMDRIASQNWDPTLPPTHYKPAPTLGRTLITVFFVVIGVSILGFIVTAVLFNLLSG